jgi:glyoxylase-like metal-dependent hydrolase (beta-lactamase superfamily II)
MHFNSAHIAADGASILVDAGLIEYSPGSIWWPPRIERSPGIVAGLATIGVRPEDVTHLVITHAHDDHFAGATERRGDADEPRFPRARCYAGRADWVDNAALREPGSIEARTLGVLLERGQLELVEGDLDLTPSVRIVAAPGETPGHVVVRVGSNGQTLYCLGDLYHHPVEVEQPSWVPHDRDRAAKTASRAALTAAALAEDARLIVAHIPGLGRLRPTPTGVAWAPA